MLSRAGKTIMLKSVAQAIPSYCMSCFLLPKMLCQDIEKMMNDFWWSSNSNNNRGIRWLSWEKMSMARNEGGLGFRNLYGFNVALLGKHCWNFLNKLNSLVSRVFKARYFPNTSFSLATRSGGASYIWSGIWTAKETLIRGFRWVVEDGKSIEIFRDGWLRNKVDFRVDLDHFSGIR